ncbi:hypothetical protein DSECCO2_409910 [anaerobic digester metagenome]
MFDRLHNAIQPYDHLAVDPLVAVYIGPLHEISLHRLPRKHAGIGDQTADRILDALEVGIDPFERRPGIGRVLVRCGDGEVEVEITLGEPCEVRGECIDIRTAIPCQDLLGGEIQVDVVVDVDLAAVVEDRYLVERQVRRLVTAPADLHVGDSLALLVEGGVEVVTARDGDVEVVELLLHQLVVAPAPDVLVLAVQIEPGLVLRQHRDCEGVVANECIPTVTEPLCLDQLLLLLRVVQVDVVVDIYLAVVIEDRHLVERQVRRLVPIPPNLHVGLRHPLLGKRGVEVVAPGDRDVEVVELLLHQLVVTTAPDLLVLLVQVEPGLVLRQHGDREGVELDEVRRPLGEERRLRFSILFVRLIDVDHQEIVDIPFFVDERKRVPLHDLDAARKLDLHLSLDPALRADALLGRLTLHAVDLEVVEAHAGEILLRIAREVEECLVGVLDGKLLVQKEHRDWVIQEGSLVIVRGELACLQGPVQVLDLARSQVQNGVQHRDKRLLLLFSRLFIKSGRGVTSQDPLHYRFDLFLRYHDRRHPASRRDRGCTVPQGCRTWPDARPVIHRPDFELGRNRLRACVVLFLQSINLFTRDTGIFVSEKRKIINILNRLR